MKDLYEIIQVHPAAEPEVIRAAFHRLAQKYHPDRSSSPDATARMSELNSAWKILSDPESRAWYDSQRTPPADPGRRPSPAPTAPEAAAPRAESAVNAPAAAAAAPAAPCGRCGSATAWVPHPAGCFQLAWVSLLAGGFAVRVAFETDGVALVGVVGVVWLGVMAHLVNRKTRTCGSCQATYEQAMF